MTRDISKLFPIIKDKSGLNRRVDTGKEIDMKMFEVILPAIILEVGDNYVIDDKSFSNLGDVPDGTCAIFVGGIFRYNGKEVIAGNYLKQKSF